MGLSEAAVVSLISCQTPNLLSSLLYQFLSRERETAIVQNSCQVPLLFSSLLDMYFKHERKMPECS